MWSWQKDTTASFQRQQSNCCDTEKEVMPTGIPLGKGVFAIVDDEDAMAVLLFASWYNNPENYARCQKDGKEIYLHDFIAKRMGLKGPVDHKSRNPLDDRRENLREATRGQNQSNRESVSQSGFRGVIKNRHRWEAQIRQNGEKFYLGIYDTKEAAAKAYDVEAKKRFGDFAILNFPDKSS
jgi:AP2 domain